MKALLQVFSAVILLSTAGAFAQEPNDIFANMPDYTLKEGTAGSPRTDVPWLRVSRPAMTDGKKKSICQLTATVQRAYDAFNRMNHTEFIAEVDLEKSERPVLKEDFVVIHSDRWQDLGGDDANPFVAGSSVVIDVRGDPKDLDSLEFAIQGIRPNQRPDGASAKAPPSNPSQGGRSVPHP